MLITAFKVSVKVAMIPEKDAPPASPHPGSSAPVIGEHTFTLKLSLAFSFDASTVKR